jgi:hypothetical protein
VPVRERLGAALRASNAVESLGDERIGPRHFVANAAIVRLRRYRVQTPAGARYLTLQLAATGTLLGVLVEE